MAEQQARLPIGDMEISADSLGPLVLGRSIKLMLRDGTYVSGKDRRTEIGVNVPAPERRVRKPTPR